MKRGIYLLRHEPGEPGSGRGPGRVSLAECPVLDDARLVFDSAQNLTRMVRRLRRSMRRCTACPGRGACPVIERFNDLVDQALEEVWDEWNANIGQ